MKRILTIILTLFAVFLFTVSAVCAPELAHTDILKPDNSTEIPVTDSEPHAKASEKADDLPKASVTTIYDINNNSAVVYTSEVETYLSLGWYIAPVSTIYSPDNTSAVVYTSEVETYLSLGWYAAPVTTIYAAKGATAVVYTSEVESYLTLGWYLSPDDVPKNKVVAITYDDGPSKYTPQILDCLARYNAKATFFAVGTNVSRYPETLRRALSMGMEIGNHSVSHPNLKNLSSSRAYSEINDNANNIERITGVRPKLVRPPYGSYSNTTLQTINQPFILWSIDTLDWKSRNADSVVSAVLSKVKDGDIILMHDTYQSTAAATERIIPELAARGFDMVTVSELAKIKGKTLETKAYSSFK